MKRVWLSLLAGIMVLLFVPHSAFADQPDVNYIERTWESPRVYDATLSFKSAHPGETYNVVTSSTDTLTEGWWVVPADTTISSRVQVSGEVHLIITAAKTLTCEDGIGVPKDNSLTVYGGDDSSSVLDAKVKAGGSHAAIGGEATSTGTGGEIIIKSGTVNVSDNKGSRNAGIGGGDNGTFQLVEIYGGNITATGGDSGPGIGNGAGAKYDPGESGKVCVYGGNVRAVGNAGGAGIGGGAESYGVITEVNGGTVIAEGGSYSGQGVEYAGAGIGSGCNCEQGLGRGIELDAGNITAKGGSAGGAGIGGGLGGAGGFVNVGGFAANNVVVKAIGGKNASGIGGGSGKANQGRQVWFDGGTLEAIANEGESTGGGFAIGNAVTEYEGDDLHVRDDAKVTYAASEAGDKTVALRDERVSKAKESKYAKMEACDHGGFNYTKKDGYKHKVECKYCEESHEEDHSFEEGSVICTKNCGFDGISVTFSPGENGSGEAYTEKIQPGNYEVPDNTKFTPKDESLPCFSGWSYGSGKEAFPGEKLQITEDTEFTARWLSERDRVKVTLRWSSIDGLDKVAPKPIWLKKDEGTIFDLGEDKWNEIKDHFTSIGGYAPMKQRGRSLPILATPKQIGEYSSLEEAYDDDDGYTRFSEDTELFVLMAKPAEKLSFSLEKPICGTEVKFKPGTQQEGAPVVSVKDDSHVDIDPEKSGPAWMNRESPGLLDNTTLVGGSKYLARVYVREKIGYYIEEDIDITATIDNVDPHEISTMRIYEYGEIRFLAAAAHEQAEPEVEVIKEATCEEPGTCNEVIRCKGYDVCHTEYSSQQKTIPAKGHDWEFKGFNWTGDETSGYTADNANYTCKNDENHKNTANAAITEAVTAPTCAVGGKTTYTATVTAEESPDKSLHAESKEAKFTAPDPDAHKWNDGEVTTEPSCTEKGVITYTCEHNKEHTKTGEIDALGHDWSEWKVTKAPTQTSEGEEERVCSRCSEKETRTIPKIDPKPAARAVLVAKGIASGKKAVNISWNNVGADRYVIYLGRCKYNGKTYKMKKVKTVSGKTLKMKKTGLKARTAYKFYVVAQKKSGGNYVNIAKSAEGHFFTGNLRGRYTNPKKLKLKKTAFTLSKGKSATIKGTVTKARRGKRLATSHAKLLRFTSNNPAVATVNSKGKVTAKSKGTAVIYVQTINGIWKTCKVTVR